MIKNNKNLFSGVFFGLLLAAIIWILFYVFFPIENSSKKQLEFTLTQLDKSQKELGLQCRDIDAVILDYINSVKFTVEKPTDEGKLLLSDSIIIQGEKAIHLVAMCDDFNRRLTLLNDNTLNNSLFKDGSVQMQLSIVRSSLSQLTVNWCDFECNQSLRKQILENSNLILNRLKNQ